MDWYVTFVALAAGSICFLIYVASAVLTMIGKPHQAATEMVAKAKAMPPPGGASAADYTKLLEAAAKLTDSLSKAGPTLVSLIGAILFVLIAAVSSGALKNAPPAAVPAPSPAATK